MRIRTLELARTGTWGQDGATITQQDLAEVKANFAGAPPLTLGHLRQGQTEGPRYGRVLAVDLAEKGNLLLGTVEFGDVADGAYQRGLYDGWSVSIPRRAKDGTRYLHHLALLGETPPKIPGLREAGAVANYEYADGDHIETYTFGGTIKEREDISVDPAKELAELKEKFAALEAENKKLREEKEAAEKAAAEAKAPAEKEDKGAAAPAAPPAEPDGGKDFADRLAKMEGEVCKSRVEILMAKVSGKIPEGLKDKVRGLAGRIAGDDAAFNFSDGGKDTSAKAIELLGEILGQWPAPVKTGSEGFQFADDSGKSADWGKVAAGM
ncbi:MAG: hypothetical protein LBQ14_07125 [Treponema sp.]|jgi:hypothetical protein|nr:hypothetical protein [Treponema sp.]